ncbi:uncharacterized protein LOC131166084 [Malania oleifera]|uniref:uncharacterized protein LOC131166084 n=1 Tax=Malania oleifera TaxID=397392 RepID=UPI0025AE877C|nr:uncharacterized protein LOC131166084 [Malania oleifera]
MAAPAPRTIMDFMQLEYATASSSTILPYDELNFMMQRGRTSLLPEFYGTESECPYQHLAEFELTCNMFFSHAKADESIRLNLFLATLQDRALIWFHSLRPHSITNWTDMEREFSHMFCSSQKTQFLQEQILNFVQQDDETFRACWERFKDLLRTCPHHGFDSWRLADYFYSALTPDWKCFVQTMSNGEPVSEDPDQVLSFFDYLADNVPQCNTRYTQAPMTAHPISTISGGDAYEPPNCPDIPLPQYQPQQISQSCTPSEFLEDSITQMANMLQQFMQTQIDHNNELRDTINAISTQLDILENEKTLAEPQPSSQEYQQPQQQIHDISLETTEETITFSSEKDDPQSEMLIVGQIVVPAPEVTTEIDEFKEKLEETSPKAEHLVDEETNTHTEYQPVVPHTPSSETMEPSSPPESDVKEPNEDADSCSGMMVCTPDKEGDQSGELIIFKEPGKTFNVNASEELQV